MNRIIAAHAGTGKSTFCRMYPNAFVDFTCMKYKYIVPDDYVPEDEESIKASYNHEFRMFWQYDYAAAIMRYFLEDYDFKTLVIPSEHRVLELLRLEGIKYTLCYPERSAKDVYRQRFVERGNNERFLEIFIDKWDNWIDTLEKTEADRRIVMKPHEYLSDVIDIEEYKAWEHTAFQIYTAAMTNS